MSRTGFETWSDSPVMLSLPAYIDLVLQLAFALQCGGKGPPEGEAELIEKYAHQAVEQNKIAGDNNTVHSYFRVLLSKDAEQDYTGAEKEGERQGAPAHQQTS